MTHLTPAAPTHRARRQRAIAAAADALPTPAEMRANLLATLATADALGAETEGLAWYRSAHSVAADLATAHRLPLATAVGVLAAFSPQCGWAENIRLAAQACEHASNGRTDLISGHTADACAKVSRILQGEDPDAVLGGRKVRSFYRNILRPNEIGAVTIDRHAVDMLCGRRGAVHDRILERPGAYATCAAVIRSVARELGYRPHEIQAIAWVAWRMAHDVAYRYDPDSF